MKVKDLIEDVKKEIADENAVKVKEKLREILKMQKQAKKVLDKIDKRLVDLLEKDIDDVE